MIRIETRQEVRNRDLWLAFALALGLGLVATAGLVAASGASVTEAFATLLAGAFGSRSAVLGSLVKATPLILTGLATVVAFRAQIWNIGQEGQVFAGAMAAYWASLSVPGLPTYLAVPLIILAGMSGGAGLGWVAGGLKTRFGVNEIISTVMLNYVIFYLLSFMLAGGPWMATGVATAYHQSPELPGAVRLPLMVANLHVGFIVALAASVVCYLLLEHTPLGLEIRGHGFNATAMRFQGVNTRRTVLMVMVISGAVAGIAGVTEVFGVNQRLRADYLVGLGYTGIIIGMIGGLRPLGTVLAALFFGGLENGALYMKILAGVPSALVPAMEGIILLFFLCAGVVVRFRFHFVRRSTMDLPESQHD